MDSTLDKNIYTMIESAGFARAGNVYQIYDSDENRLFYIVEEIPGIFKKLCKFTPLKTLLGFNIKFLNEQNNMIIQLRRSFTFFLSNIKIYDHENNLLGAYKQKLKMIIAKFDILDDKKNKIAILKGDWRDWKFQMYRPDRSEIGRVNKKWAGFYKEIFTTADKYFIYAQPAISEKEKLLLLASSVVIDMVLKEYT